jgi:putative peptidoglycan binding protein
MNLPHNSYRLHISTGIIAAFLAAASTASAQAFPISSNDGNIEVDSVGGVQTVFQHSTQQCVVPGSPYADIPDTPAHAFRNASGQVILSDSNASNFQNVGTTLDNVVHSCNPSMTSAMNPDYDADTYQEWLHSGGYTLDGTNVFALIHNEWHAAPNCDPNDNWVNSITLMTSSNGGLWYAHPANYKIRVPPVPWSASYPCTGTGRTVYGSFGPSNIIKSRTDGFYYSFFTTFADPAGLMDSSDCVMRTDNLADASSWKVWAQGSWQPALTTPRCSNITPFSVNTGGVFSVTYNTYLGAYIIIIGGQTGANGGSIWYSLSQDLMNWSPLVQLLALPNDPYQYYGSLLDPTDTSVNFENTGQMPYLYLTTYHPEDSTNRDLVREQIKFTKLKAAPPPPVCTPDPSSPQAQSVACPAGTTGSITQTRTSTCPGPAWSAWATTANTCVAPPTCTPDPSSPQAQALACPLGTTGSITQTRTSACPGPTWGGWTTTANTCSAPPAPCTFNNQSIPDGQSVTAYQSGSIAAGSQCVGELRVCTNGTLSGVFQYPTCVAANNPSCTPNWLCSLWSACTSRSHTRSCVDISGCGTSTGEPATTESCSATANSCIFNNKTIPDGQSATAYRSAVIPRGTKCVAETRTCQGGVLSGNFKYTSCAYPPGTTTPPPISSTPPTTSTTQACVSLTRNLGLGSRGADVTKLQNFLIAGGYLAAGNNSGYYGKLTQSAVQAYQRAHGLVSSGTPATTGYGAVGPKTRAALSHCH